MRCVAWCPGRPEGVLAMANDSGWVQVWSLLDPAFACFETRLVINQISLGVEWLPSGLALLLVGANQSTVSAVDLVTGRSEAYYAHRHPRDAAFALDAVLQQPSVTGECALVVASAGADGDCRIALVPHAPRTALALRLPPHARSSPLVLAKLPSYHGSAPSRISAL